MNAQIANKVRFVFVIINYSYVSFPRYPPHVNHPPHRRDDPWARPLRHRPSHWYASRGVRHRDTTSSQITIHWQKRNRVHTQLATDRRIRPYPWWGSTRYSLKSKMIIYLKAVALSCDRPRCRCDDEFCPCVRRLHRTIPLRSDSDGDHPTRVIRVPDTPIRSGGNEEYLPHTQRIGCDEYIW